jgi:hypothetical protein
MASLKSKNDKATTKEVRVMHGQRRSKANPEQKRQAQDMAVSRVHQAQPTVVDHDAAFNKRKNPPWLILSPSHIPKEWGQLPRITHSSGMKVLPCH